MNKMILKILGGLLGLYLLSTGVSYVTFSFFVKTRPSTVTPQDAAEGRKKIDLQAPKTEECPLTGEKFTKAEKEIWEGRRPLGIMVENHEEARPQSGLSKADIVYEAIAEGGITRFIAIYYCAASAEEVTVGPVRSARTYYLDWISEYGDYPLYAHVGGANKPGPADALGQIIKYGWSLYNDLNQFSVDKPPLTFKRDYDRLPDRATEHTMYSTTDKLWKAAEFRGLTNKDKQDNLWSKNFTTWKFGDGKTSSSPTAPKIEFPFWESYSQYEVTWTYDSSTNQYKRDIGNQPQKDLNNNVQITTSNVVIIFTQVQGPIDELKHMLYKTTGTGKALVFQGGEAIEGTWTKKERTARTKFTDKKGKEIEFVRGPIWIEVLSPTTKVTY